MCGFIAAWVPGGGNARLTGGVGGASGASGAVIRVFAGSGTIGPLLDVRCGGLAR
jgi:hypothetical protein